MDTTPDFSSLASLFDPHHTSNRFKPTEMQFMGVCSIDSENSTADLVTGYCKVCCLEDGDFSDEVILYFQCIRPMNVGNSYVMFYVKDTETNRGKQLLTFYRRISKVPNEIDGKVECSLYEKPVADIIIQHLLPAVLIHSAVSAVNMFLYKGVAVVNIDAFWDFEYKINNVSDFGAITVLMSL